MSRRALSRRIAGPAAEQPRRAQVHFAVAAPQTRLHGPSAPPGRPSRRHPHALTHAGLRNTLYETVARDCLNKLQTAMAYYIDLFSPETYEAFARSSRDISGFRRRH